MASSSSISMLLLFMFLNLFHLSIQESNSSKPLNQSLSGSSNLTTNHESENASGILPTNNFKGNFSYSMALIASIPIGTPPQPQQMVMDTGSQLSWVKCQAPNTPPSPSLFNPTASSTFSPLPCNDPICTPTPPDFNVPTTCDDMKNCHYSYFFADGTLAEGNLVKEKISLSSSQNSPPLILGCATTSKDEEGILGLNQGRLSYVTQTKLDKFSYCVPAKTGRSKVVPGGTFYLGQNPNSNTFKYMNLLTFPPSQQKPNLDTLAYTVPLIGIRIGAKKLDIPPTVFAPDAGGSGQTFIDSGTQYTYLVDGAYNKVREEVARLVGPKLKNGYVYSQSMDMCFDGNDPVEIGNMIGDMVLEFEGVEILVNKERLLDNVEPGILCFGMGRSQILGVSNIIGNFHQQNYWVEFDVANKRVGLGPTNCATAQ